MLGSAELWRFWLQGTPCPLQAKTYKMLVPIELHLRRTPGSYRDSKLRALKFLRKKEKTQKLLPGPDPKFLEKLSKNTKTWWTFDIFYQLGGEEGEVRGSRKGGGFIEIPGEGGLPREGGGARGTGRVSAESFLGGGAKYLFRGRNCHQEKYPKRYA